MPEKDIVDVAPVEAAIPEVDVPQGDTPAAPESVNYPLSATQQKFAKIHQNLVAKKRADMDDAMSAYRRAEGAHAEASSLGDLFLAYIVEEFELPKVAEGYQLTTNKDGSLSLTGTRSKEIPSAEPGT